MRLATRGRLFPLGLLLGLLLLRCHSTEDSSSSPHQVEHLFAAHRQIYPRLSVQQSASPCREELPGLLVRWKCSSLQREQSTSRSVLALGSSLRREIQRSGSPDSHYWLGLWYVLVSPDLDGVDAAIDQLAAATEARPGNASWWSDLAALYGWKASLAQDPRSLHDAFHAAERAVRLDPDDPEALFNRAWILDLLQLPGAAHQAWQAYLSQETAHSPWRREADQRLEQSQAPTLTSTWDVGRLNRDLAAGLLADPPIAAFAAAAPSSSLHWVTTSLLPAWGEAWKAGDAVNADRHLHAARVVAEVFWKKWKDALLLDGISGIESTIRSGSRQRASRLIEGLSAFRDAVEDHARSRPASVLVHLETVARGFRGNAEALQDLAADYEAASLYAQGQYAQARGRLQELSEEISDRPYPYLKARLLHRRGSVENVSGNPENARQHLQDALKIFEHFSDPEYMAFVNALLGETYNELGDRERSWKCLYKALLHSRRLGLPYREVQIYNILADFTLRGGDAKLSYMYQDAAVQASSQLDNPSFGADVLLWRALLNARFGRLDDASRDLQAAARQTAKIVDPSRAEQSRADAGLISGAIALEKDPAAAVQLLDRAVARYQKTGHWPNRLLAHEARAQAYRKLGQTSREKADLLLSLEIHERIGRHLTEDAYRLSLAGFIESAFDQMVLLEAVKEKNPERAVYFLERSRTVSWPILNPRQPLEPVTPEALSEVLPQRTALVEYSLLTDRLLIWTRTTTATEFHEVAIQRDEIEALVDSFAEGDWRWPRWKQSSLRLYQILISPWFEAGRYDTVVVVPDKDLFRISFPALWNPATHRFLIEDAAVLLSPSATLFAHATRRDRHLARGNRKPRILVVADPAPHSDKPQLAVLERSRQEGERIRALFPHSTVLLTGSAAVPSTFLGHLPSASWIHFAGHAVASPDRPLDSFLVFAKPSDGSSGEITGKELQERSFPRTRCVVLSACSTAAVPGLAWPGAMTLARPFLTAGVPAVLGSLWRVEDRQAQRLFDTFYESLHAGSTPAEALRTAQLRMLREAGHDSLRKNGWPAFQLIGGLTSNHPLTEELQ